MRFLDNLGECMRIARRRDLLLNPLNLELCSTGKLTVQKVPRLSGRHLLNDEQPLLQHLDKNLRIDTHALGSI
ncbi:hypothetical protein CV770_22000 [Bradyrhizobium sp. AC87j1]|nr:hypothetical protein CV770_22000 [Bradyrhizobium sp. AC87j1]